MDVKQLQEQRMKLAAEIKRRAGEFKDNDKQWKDDAERQAFERVSKDYDAVLAKLDEARAAEDVGARLAALDEYDNRSATEGQQRPGMDVGKPADHDQRTQPTEEHRVLALQAWMRTGEGRPLTDAQREACQLTGVNPRAGHIDFDFDRRSRRAPRWYVRGHNIESRDLNVTTSTQGQETIPEGFMPELERTLLAYGGPRQVARVLRTASGNDIPWPTVNDTSNTGELLNEATSIGSSVDPAFSSVTLGAYKYSSKPVLISAELLEDSAFDLGAEVGAMLGERIGRITATHFTTGDNSSKPQGLVTGASAGKTTASGTAIADTEVLDLVHSLDPAYRNLPSLGFMFHDNIFLYLRKLQDSNGAFIWQPGMSGGEPDRLVGYPFTINQDMASSVATTNVTMLFGAFEKYIIRDVASVRAYRLEERYRETDQTGFITMSRHDGRYINTGAVKKMTQA